MLWTMNGMYMPNNITEIHSSYYLSDIAFKIPNVECNITFDFAHNSERNNYLKGLATLDNNWHYRHKKVIYKYNSLGYRTKEFDEINKENFFLSYGCSFTEGTGLAEDEIWCSLVADNLKIDCLNYGKGGQGIEFIHLNVMAFLKNSSHMPKFVIIQIPNSQRISTRSLENFRTLTPPNTAWERHKEKFPKDFYFEEIDKKRSFYTYFITLLNIDLMFKLCKIPVIYWVKETELSEKDVTFFFKDSKIQKKFIFADSVDSSIENLARDLAHDGPNFHQSISNKLINLIKEKL